MAKTRAEVMTVPCRALLCLPVALFLHACGDSGKTETLTSDPGQITLRRLNRTEYNNTVRDLLDDKQQPANQFPDDDVGEGFDNIGQVLSVSPLHIELWQRAAESLVAEALRPDGAPEQKQFGPDQLHHGSGVVRRGDDLVITSDNEISTLFELGLDGHYTIQIRAYEDHAGADFAHMEVSVDHRPPQVINVMATSAQPAVYKVEVDLFAGPHSLAIAFTNSLPDPGPVRALAVSWARIDGPAGKERPNPELAKILICTPKDDSRDEATSCAQKILGRFARLAWRRPPEADELKRLIELFQTGLDEEEDFVAGLKVAMQGVLMSPHFLYHVELDPDPDSQVPHPLTSFELASRLSYFLWSSAPDEALLNQAEAGGLSSADGITAEVGRLLADPRAAALVDNFAAQWLALRALDNAEPDTNTYSNFRPTLRTAMAEETRRYLREFFPQLGAPANLTLQQLPSAPFAYVNLELAQHYGLPAPVGTDWTRVSLEGTARRGVVTQGSVLLMTSYPSRTSPVRRGKWVLEQLLCSPPPPPPPNVIGNFGNGPGTGTLRQRLEQHRSNAFCAACHKSMDPIGFALENFDGIGTYRTMDGGAPVDASGVLPDGRTFQNATELADILAADPQLGRCALQKMFTFALGRVPTADDTPALDAIHNQLTTAGYPAAELALQIALSDAFRTRRGAAPATDQPVTPSTARTSSGQGGAP